MTRVEQFGIRDENFGMQGTTLSRNLSPIFCNVALKMARYMDVNWAKDRPLFEMTKRRRK